MKVLHSYFDPIHDRWPTARVVAYVDAEAGTADCLHTALWSIAAHLRIEVVTRPGGIYYLPGVGHFWIEGALPQLEERAGEFEGGPLHGCMAMIAHYNRVVISK